MSKRSVALAAVVFALGCVGWAVAQSGSTSATSGQYQVSPMGDSAVLLNASTGRTWVLQTSVDGKSWAWLPAERIEDADGARKWQAVQENLRESLAKDRNNARATPEDGASTFSFSIGFMR